MMGLTLPVFNDKGTKNILNLLVGFNLSPATDKLVHGTMVANIVFQSINKLLISLHSIDVCNQGLMTNKDLSTCRTIINGRGVSIYGISSHRLLMPMHIESWKSGLEMLPER